MARESCQREESCHDQVCHRACDCDVPVFGVHGPGAGLSRRACKARSPDESKRRAARRHRHVAQRRDRRRRRRASPTPKGRYLFDFVDPGTYTMTAELQGFKKAEQKNVRVQQRGDVTVDLIAGRRRRRGDGHGRSVAPVRCSSTRAAPTSRSSAQLIDQVPISGRNPYNLANLDPTIVQHRRDDAAREPSVPPRLRQRLRRRRRHPPRQRRAARRRAARRQLQDRLHAVDGRGRGDHRLEEQRRRRERPQPRRHHQPEHEVGHQQLHGSGYCYCRDPSLNSISRSDDHARARRRTRRRCAAPS